MADDPTLQPELSRSVSALARTLVAAARSWALYPPHHPAVGGSLDRLRRAISDAGRGAPFSFGVTAETLLVEGIPVSGRDLGAVTDAAGWLHDRDILQLTFAGDIAVPSLQRLLGMLSEDSRLVRQRGGPAKVWAEDGDASVFIQQIDFSHVLQDHDVVNPSRRKDDIWRSIVRSVLDRRKSLDEATQARMLDIAGDIVAIGELARDVIAPHHTPDGSPMLTSQAAAVVAAYRHLVGIVDVLSPERRQAVIANLAAATATLKPHVIMQMLHPGQEGTLGAGTGDAATGPLLAGIVDALDDTKVAQLLATTLAIEGQASARLASVFDTIAPDAERKRRVLSLTRRLLDESEFSRRDEFHTLWSSMEELLLTYNEHPFVSDDYRGSLDSVGARAERIAITTDVEPELAVLLDTLGQESVRQLSVTLLIDLLDLETDAARAPELARDVAAMAEDLLLAGDYESALAVVTALAEHATNPGGITAQGSRVALDALVSTVAFHEAAEVLDAMTDREAALFARICGGIGPASADALLVLIEPEAQTPGRTRASAIVKGFGARAVSRLAPLLAGSWTARRNTAELLGEIGAAEAVPLLQPLLRAQDPRVVTAAVRALASIKDPAAARAIHTVLRSATGAQRRAVVETLVALRDARVVPVLVRIIEESDPFGADHPIVLATIDALSIVGDDQAVPALATLMRRRKFLARKKVTAVKRGSVDALRAIRTPAADRALADAVTTGDRLLRRVASEGGARVHG